MTGHRKWIKPAHALAVLAILALCLTTANQANLQADTAPQRTEEPGTVLQPTKWESDPQSPDPMRQDNFPPGPPTITGVSTTTNSFSVTWTPPTDVGSSAITGYRLGYRSDTTLPERSFSASPTTRTWSHRTLESGTTYFITVCARNSSGYSESSCARTTATTKSPQIIKRPGPPSITRIATGIRQAEVHWNAPTYTGTSAITGYTVEYRVYTATTFGNSISTGPNDSSAFVSNLTPGTSYYFRVTVTNSAGGTHSQEVRATTKRPSLNRPGIPRNLAATQENDKVTVTWDPPSVTGSCTITRYVLQYKESEATSYRQTKTWSSGPYTFDLSDDLEENTTYDLRIRAQNCGGPGGYAAISLTIADTKITLRELLVDGEAPDGFVSDDETRRTFNAEFAGATTSAVVKATATEATHTTTIEYANADGTPADPATGTGSQTATVPLQDGNNLVTVTVAKSGDEKITYQLQLYRYSSQPHGLAGTYELRPHIPDNDGARKMTGLVVTDGHIWITTKDSAKSGLHRFARDADGAPTGTPVTKELKTGTCSIVPQNITKSGQYLYIVRNTDDAPVSVYDTEDSDNCVRRVSLSTETLPDSASGIYLDGATLYAAEYLRDTGTTTHAITGFTATIGDTGMTAYGTRTVLAEKDVNYSTGDGEMGGIWTDGATMWVTQYESFSFDGAAGIAAYNIADWKLAPVKSNNNLISAGNQTPVSMSFHDGKVYVLDQRDEKIYIYNGPPSDDTSATVLVQGSGPKDANTFIVDRELEKFTVTVEPPHDEATYEITPSDEDTDTEGHQITLSWPSTSFEVTVTAEDLIARETTLHEVKPNLTDDEWTDTSVIVTFSPVEVHKTGPSTTSEGGLEIITKRVLFGNGSEEIELTIETGEPKARLDTEGLDENNKVNLSTSQGRDTVEMRVIAPDGETITVHRFNLNRISNEPKNLTARPNHASMELTWEAPDDLGDRKITQYHAEYRKSEETDDNKKTVKIWETTAGELHAPSLTGTVTGLEDVEYTFWVQPRYQDYEELEIGPLSNSAAATPGGPPEFDTGLGTTLTVEEDATPDERFGDPFTATDPNDDALTYWITSTTDGGGDHEHFSVDHFGYLSPLKTDGLRLGATFSITINVRDSRDRAGDPDTASDDTHDLVITVSNAQEPGTVTLDPSYPSVGVEIAATLTDPDGGLSAQTWIWERSLNQAGDWTATGGTASAYTPVDADLAHYLRATVTYTDDLASGQQASAVTEAITLADTETVQFSEQEYYFPVLEGHTYGPGDSSIGSIGAGPGAVTYSITAGDDTNKYTVGSTDGVLTLTTAAAQAYSATATDDTLTVTATKGTETTTAQVTIRIVKRLDDGETHQINNIKWTRIPETRFIMALETLADTTEIRRPDLELNAQIRCRNQYIGTDTRARAYDMVFWLDEGILRYQEAVEGNRNPMAPADGSNPLLSPHWHTFDLNTPHDDLLRTGHRDTECQPEVTDLWAENYETEKNGAHGLIYQLDAANRLIKAYDIGESELSFTRNHALDIPITDDHFRGPWPIQGIWADDTHVWVSAAQEAEHDTSSISAAYSRTTFTRDTGEDITESPSVDGSTHSYRPDDYWLQDNVHWMIHTQDEKFVVGVDPGSPGDHHTCQPITGYDDMGDPILGTAAKVEIRSSLGPAHALRRITGRKANADGSDSIYVLSYSNPKILDINRNGCSFTQNDTRYAYNLIDNIPADPNGGYSQRPTGIATTKAFQVIYTTYLTGEIRYMFKIIPLLEEQTFNMPENMHDGSWVGSSLEVSGQEAHHTWEITDADAALFGLIERGPHNRTVQVTLNQGKDYETDKKTYNITLTATDPDGNSTNGNVTFNLTNVQEQPTGQLLITEMTAYANETLTADVSRVDDPDGLTNPTFHYQWYAGHRAISGATGATHTVSETQAERRDRIYVEITFEDDGGFNNKMRSRTIRAGFPRVEAAFGSAPNDLDEGQSVTLTIRLSRAPKRDVSIRVRPVYSKGSNPDDIEGQRTTLEFGPEDTSLTITVTAVQDDYDEDDEPVILRLVNLPEAVRAGATASHTINIIDDDTSGVEVDSTTITVAEANTATYTVKLTSEPRNNVTIEPDDLAEISFNTNKLTFTPDNWDTAQTVTITAEADGDAVADPVKNISHTAESDDTKYNAIPIDPIAVTVQESNTAGFQYEQTKSELMEGEGGATSANCGSLPDTGPVLLGTLYFTSEPTARVDLTLSGHTGTPLCLRGSSDEILTSDTEYIDGTGRAYEFEVFGASKQDDGNAVEEVANMTATLTSTDTDYDGLEVKFDVTLRDNEPEVLITLDASAHAAAEGGTRRHHHGNNRPGPRPPGQRPRSHRKPDWSRRRRLVHNGPSRRQDTAVQHRHPQSHVYAEGHGRRYRRRRRDAQNLLRRPGRQGIRRRPPQHHRDPCERRRRRAETRPRHRPGTGGKPKPQTHLHRGTHLRARRATSPWPYPAATKTG